VPHNVRNSGKFLSDVWFFDERYAALCRDTEGVVEGDPVRIARLFRSVYKLKHDVQSSYPRAAAAMFIAEYAFGIRSSLLIQKHGFTLSQE